MYVALKWLKTSIETLKWKFDSIWTSILREIDVDMTSMYSKNTLRIPKNNSGNLRVPCDWNEILAYLYVLWLAFWNKLALWWFWAFSFYSVLTTLPYILNKINVIKVVKVIL